MALGSNVELGQSCIRYMPGLGDYENQLLQSVIRFAAGLAKESYGMTFF